MSSLVATIIAASVLGSFHCVGMCGGFVAFYSADSRARSNPWTTHAAYNVGRLLTYVVLGAVAGVLGAALNLAGNASGIGHIAALLSGGLIIVSGALMLATAAGVRWANVPVPIAFNALIGRVLRRLREAPGPVRAAALGVSSALLPCGWLYGFAVTAAGTGSATAGAIVMAAFWVGTVPAMVGVGLGAQHLARAIGPRLGVLMPLMLIVMGVMTVIQRGFITGAPGASVAALAAGAPS